MMTEMEIRLKENLRALLKARGCKAADLARLTGVSPSVISEWMAGRAPRNVRNIHKLARELGVSMEELCFGKGEALLRKAVIGEDAARKGRFSTRGKEIFPLLLPIRESGILEFHVRWVKTEKDKPPD